MRTSINIRRGPWTRVALLLAVLVVVGGCGGAAAPLEPAGDAYRLSGGGGADDTRDRLNLFGSDAGQPVEQPAPEQASGEANPNPNTNPILDAVRPDLLIIKTGSLDLQVEAVDEAVTEAAARVIALGGYVSGSEQFGEGDDVTATITYRIPAEAWEDALTALRSLAIKIVSERTGTQDVTGQVVDLRARITNLRATETALQGIMTRATKIADVLAVQAELTTVRGQIEEATAQKQRLEEQAAFSTLSVRFGLKPEAAVVTVQQRFDPKSEVDRATANLVEILQGLVTAGIWFGIVWLPIMLVLAFVALVVAVVGRRWLPRRGRGSDLQPPTTPAEPEAPLAAG